MWKLSVLILWVLGPLGLPRGANVVVLGMLHSQSKKGVITLDPFRSCNQVLDPQVGSVYVLGAPGSYALGGTPEPFSEMAGQSQSAGILPSLSALQ